jgi:hypothetical protein
MLFPQQVRRPWWKGGGISIYPVDHTRLPWWTYYESNENAASGEAEIIIEPKRVYPHPLPRAQGIAWTVLCGTKAVDGSDPIWQYRSNIEKIFDHVAEKDVAKFEITLAAEIMCELKWNNDEKTPLYRSSTSQLSSSIVVKNSAISSRDNSEIVAEKSGGLVRTISAISPLISSSSQRLPTPPASPHRKIPSPPIIPENRIEKPISVSHLYGNTADNGRAKELMTRILINATNMGIHVRSATLGSRPGQMIFTL